MVVEEELQKIREIVNPYTNEDVYNMDEFVLFLKITLDGTLETEQKAGSKHDKVYITINFACNITGYYKFEP